ncbi:hypothetical protein TELCIR_03700 [Teladorsagia circumcincta]|uniref:Uncharacterized protein n=1 Tax=Teladorsagia circumcincta TaxID=45464 RepID=A0A2G9UXQ2_TELCI|nr:hypothetical protein TELCIR_03700 [Teladorsagia circumcincta]
MNFSLSDAEIVSGSIVILKNVHFALSNNRKKPILVMHEGTSHGRDIIKVEPESVRGHHRYVRLINDINKVLEFHRSHQEESDTTKEKDEVDVSLYEDSAPTSENEVDCMNDGSEQPGYSNSSDEKISEERRAALMEAFTLNADPRAFRR